MLEQFRRPYIKRYMTQTSNQYLWDPHPLQRMLNINKQRGSERWLIRRSIKTTHCHNIKWVCDLSLSVRRRAAYDPISRGYIIQRWAIQLPRRYKHVHKNKLANLLGTLPYTTLCLDVTMAPSAGGATRKASLTSISQVHQRVTQADKFKRFKLV